MSDAGAKARAMADAEMETLRRSMGNKPMTHHPDLSRVVTQLLEALEGIIDEWFDERTMAVDPFFAKARAAIAAAKKEIGE